MVASVPGVSGIPGVEVAVLGGTAGMVKILSVGGRIGGSWQFGWAVGCTGWREGQK